MLLQLIVAVDRNELRTMASDTVDPIDSPLPSSFIEVLPERLVHSINQCNTCWESTLQPSACETTTLPMRPLRLYAACYVT